MIIREARLTERRELLTMCLHFLDGTQYGAMFQVVPAALEAVVDSVFAQGVAVVAEVDGQLVGMLGALALEHPFSREVEMHELAWWVEPRYRSGACGPQMLGYLEHWTTTKGISVLKMVAPNDNPVVGRFLKRLGYRPVETAFVKVLTHGVVQEPAGSTEPGD